MVIMAKSKRRKRDAEDRKQSDALLDEGKQKKQVAEPAVKSTTGDAIIDACH